MATAASDKRTIKVSCISFLRGLPELAIDAYEKSVSIQIRTSDSNGIVTLHVLFIDAETGDRLLDFWPSTNSALTPDQRRLTVYGPLDALRRAERVRLARLHATA